LKRESVPQQKFFEAICREVIIRSVELWSNQMGLWHGQLRLWFNLLELWFV